MLFAFSTKIIGFIPLRISPNQTLDFIYINFIIVNKYLNHSGKVFNFKRGKPIINYILVI